MGKNKKKNKDKSKERDPNEDQDKVSNQISYASHFLTSKYNFNTIYELFTTI